MAWASSPDLLNGDDVTPGEDFSTPPPDNAPTGTLTGTVTDSQSGEPVAGVTVTVARQGGGRVNNPSDTTGADGTYSIPNLVVGTYPKVAVASGGFDPIQVSVTIAAGTTVQDFTVRRDWAAASGGASVTDFDGPDFTPDCGPGFAIDQSSGDRVGQHVRPRRWTAGTGHAEGDHDPSPDGGGHLADLGEPVSRLR